MLQFTGLTSAEIYYKDKEGAIRPAAELGIHAGYESDCFDLEGKIDSEETTEDFLFVVGLGDITRLYEAIGRAKAKMEAQDARLNPPAATCQNTISDGSEKPRCVEKTGRDSPDLTPPTGGMQGLLNALKTRAKERSESQPHALNVGTVFSELQQYGPALIDLIQQIVNLAKLAQSNTATAKAN